MESRTRPEIYRDFLEFIRKDIRTERRLVNRRIFSVFLWCFFIPALLSFLLIFLVRLGLLPRSSTRYMDWLLIIFPLLYTLYVLASEVLSGMPNAFRRGGLANTLNQAARDCEWRNRIMGGMRDAVRVGPEDWRWIVANFRVDLRLILHRAKYLTALAGAVFFLLMQGIDSLDSDTDVDAALAAGSVQGFFEASSNSVAQFVGLGLFLVLLYLSGTQTYHSLSRYLDGCDLIILDLEKENRKS